MQKKLLTAAVAGALAMPVAAFAQVTLFGTIDTGLRNQSKIQTTAGEESDLAVVAGQRTTNRWGFRGSEDLGGGLMANFWFEGFYTSDDATDTLDGFNRKNLIGLSKGGMSVDLGRDYTVNFKTQGIYDPMSYTYTGITPSAGRNTQGVRFNNLVTAGFRFGSGGIRVDYSTGQPADVAGADNNALGINFDWTWGPVQFGVASSALDTSDTTQTSVGNIGVAWKFGAFTLRVGASNTNAETGPGTDTDTPMFLAGLQYAISPTLNARIGYYDTSFETDGVETGTEKVMIAALDYYLSKRTTLYVSFDRQDLSLASGAPATRSVIGQTVGDGATGIGVGIAHSF
jgi:predicted porin